MAANVPWFLWSIVRPIGRPYYEREITAQPVREFSSQET